MVYRNHAVTKMDGKKYKKVWQETVKSFLSCPWLRMKLTLAFAGAICSRGCHLTDSSITQKRFANQTVDVYGNSECFTMV